MQSLTLILFIALIIQLSTFFYFTICCTEVYDSIFGCDGTIGSDYFNDDGNNYDKAC